MKNLFSGMYLLIIILLIMNSCSGNPNYESTDSQVIEKDYPKYIQTANDAGIEFRGNRYDSALKKYLESYGYWKPEPNALLNGAICALKEDKPALGYKLLEEAITNVGVDKDKLQSHEGLQGFHEDKLWQDLILDYDRLRQLHFTKHENLEVYIEIQKMIERDKMIRELHLANRLSNSSTWDIINEVDSINVIRLMEITTKHGWQPDAFLILWHQRGNYGEDNYVWNYFKPLIDEAIKNGEEKTDFWAKFIDNKSYYEQGGKQVYGTLIESKVVDGQRVPCIKEIINPETVDEERKKIGMLSLKDYCDNYNIECPENYLEYLARKN